MDVNGIGEANVDGIAHLLVMGERGFAADGGHLDLDDEEFVFCSLCFSELDLLCQDLCCLN